MVGGALTENIAVLSLCGTTFEPTTQIDISIWKSAKADNYTLSIQQEQQVAEAFAILLANTDDPHTVGAVCLEEQPKSTGLLIRTAVNSGIQGERMTSFRRIAGALQQCTAERDIDAFFGEIVAICKPRLLIRLRSSHAKPHRKANKPAIIPKLVDGVKLLRNLPLVPHQLASLQTQTTSLSAAFMSLEALSSTAAHSEPGTHMLKSILLTIDRMLASTNIGALLDMIPKNISSWSGPASQSLVKSLTSLAQYYHAAHYLLRRARKTPVFRSLSVAEVPYGLSRESSHSAEPRSVNSGLFNRLVKQADALSTRLEATLRRSRAEIKLHIHKHAAQSKRVHAEVQLLLYYEENKPTNLPPRIICSNKHACLLCDLFVRAHGRFRIRSCHGRLYPRWRIPLFEELRLSDTSKTRVEQAIEELNRQLERRIRNRIDHAQLRISDPQESIVFAPGACMSSMLSEATIPEPVVDTATELAADCSLSTITSTSTSFLGTMQQQLYIVDYGHTVVVRVYPDFPIRIHSRRIHLELTYEWALMSASSSSVTTSCSQESPTDDIGLLVQVKYFAKGSSASSSESRHEYDLAVPWKPEDIPSRILLSDSGLVLKRRNDIIVVRVQQRE